jgi:hypothetical protein
MQGEPVTNQLRIIVCRFRMVEWLAVLCLRDSCVEKAQQLREALERGGLPAGNVDRPSAESAVRRRCI